ncbi:MAG: hypothetical protein V3V99_00055, partial [candidate division Zixibacteria bacterium]
MKTHYLWICTLFVFCFSGVSTAQDFGKLLEAVDKLEASLKEMVVAEQTQREKAINTLRQELEALQANVEALKGSTAIGFGSPEEIS